jgi:hypothetical protein
MTWSCSLFPCRLTLRPVQVLTSMSETWVLPAWRGSVSRHPLLSHPTHLPTSTPSPSRWLAFVCIPMRCRLLRALSPITLTTQDWSISSTPSWDHARPRRISIASTLSSIMPCHSSQGDYHSPRKVSDAPAQPAWPYGLHNAARTYSRLTWPVEDASAGLPHHRLQSLSELLTSTVMSSNVDSEEDTGD